MLLAYCVKNESPCVYISFFHKANAFRTLRSAEAPQEFRDRYMFPDMGRHVSRSIFRCNFAILGRSQRRPCAARRKEGRRVHDNGTADDLSAVRRQGISFA